jgi:uncharacterized protein
VGWLVTDTGKVLASAEVASSRADRRRGLLGRDHIEGAFVLTPCRWVHTIGMRIPIDVVFLDADGTVIKMLQMHRHRVGAPVWSARMVVEAEAGALGRWELHMGDRLELRE